MNSSIFVYSQSNVIVIVILACQIHSVADVLGYFASKFHFCVLFNVRKINET